MLDWGALSELPLSTLDDETVAPSAAVVAATYSTRDSVYLVEIDAFQAVGSTGATSAPAAISELSLSTLTDQDEALTGIVTFRFSSGKFVTGGSDDPADTAYDPRVTQPLHFERALPVSASPACYGGIATAVGEVRLANADGALDSFVENFTIDGRRVRVRVGDRGATIDDFVTIFDGTAVGFEHTENEITIRLRSNLYRLDLPVQASTYGGTGGTDGGADLADKPKPMAYGECLNVTPAIVDSASKVYQPNDGAMSDVNAVYEGARALTLTTDYTLDLTNGLITLVASPARLITCDVKGSTTGGSYVTTAADIAKRVLIDRSGYEASRLDLNAFSQLAAEQPAVVGIYVGAQQVTGRAFLTDLLAPMGMFLADDRAGRVTIGRFFAGYATDTLVLDQRHILQITRKAAPLDPPAKTVKCGYDRNWTLQSQDISSSVTLSRKQFLAEIDRFETADDDDTANVHQLAQTPAPVRSLFASSTDAQAEAERQIAVHGVNRAVYTIRTPVGLWATRLNQPVTLTFPRWNLRNGAAGRVVRIAEDAQANEQELDIFV